MPDGKKLGCGSPARPGRGVCGLLRILLAFGIIRRGTLTCELDSSCKLGLEAFRRAGLSLHCCAQQQRLKH
ncbi:hypothetical protein ACFQH7_02670 [Microbulbifer taiwanensis]